MYIVSAYLCYNINNGFRWLVMILKYWKRSNGLGGGWFEDTQISYLADIGRWTLYALLFLWYSSNDTTTIGGMLHWNWQWLVQRRSWMKAKMGCIRCGTATALANHPPLWPALWPLPSVSPSYSSEIHIYVLHFVPALSEKATIDNNQSLIFSLK